MAEGFGSMMKKIKEQELLAKKLDTVKKYHSRKVREKSLKKRRVVRQKHWRRAKSQQQSRDEKQIWAYKAEENYLAKFLREKIAHRAQAVTSKSRSFRKDLKKMSAVPDTAKTQEQLLKYRRTFSNFFQPPKPKTNHAKTRNFILTNKYYAARVKTSASKRYDKEKQFKSFLQEHGGFKESDTEFKKRVSMYSTRGQNIWT